MNSFGHLCSESMNFGRAKSANSKNTAEAKVRADLSEKGFVSLWPDDRDCIFDCAIEVLPGIIKKIQIKSSFGSNSVPYSTRGTDSTDRNNTTYYEAGVHIIAVVSERGVFYYDTIHLWNTRDVNKKTQTFNYPTTNSIDLKTYFSGDVAELADATDLKSVEG